MSLAGVKVNLVECVDDAQEFMRWLGERHEGDVVGFDTETEGLYWWKQSCRLAQFGDTRMGWAIPFERWSGVVAEALDRYQGPLTGHNIRFDARFMYHHKIDIGRHRMHDTMLAANALWPDERLALKDLAVRRIDSHAADGQLALDDAMDKGGWTWATVPTDLPQYWAYGAMDAVLAAQIHVQTQPMLVAENLMNVYDLECAVSDVLFQMETRGARIDVPFCEQKYDELYTYSRQLRHWCQENYGVSPGSIDEVTSRLRMDGVTFTKRTDKGNISLDEEVLSAIDHPLAKAVLYVRKSEKVAGTYFRNFLQLHDNGVIHCSIKQVGAKTGRMSITEPALQTLPRDNKIVRNAFIPSDEHKLVSIDYEQIEMRLLAHFAGEEEMIRRITAGVNMHEAVAQVIYNIEGAVPHSSHQYQVTKNANFAKAFVAGAKKFGLTAGIPEEEAFAFYAMYDSTFPGVKRFQRDVMTIAEERYRATGRAFVHSPLGRLHVGDHKAVYKLVNYLIQGTAADVLKERLVALDMAGFTDYMVLPIHDEIIFDVPADDVEYLTANASEIMTDRTSFRVPLTVDASPPLDRWEKV